MNDLMFESYRSWPNNTIHNTIKIKIKINSTGEGQGKEEDIKTQVYRREEGEGRTSDDYMMVRLAIHLLLYG